MVAGAKPGATTTRLVDTDAASMENAPRASVVATTGPAGLPSWTSATTGAPAASITKPVSGAEPCAAATMTIAASNTV